MVRLAAFLGLEVPGFPAATSFTVLLIARMNLLYIIINSFKNKNSGSVSSPNACVFLSPKANSLGPARPAMYRH